MDGGGQLKWPPNIPAGSQSCLNPFLEWAEPSIASCPLPAAVMKPAARM